jgi:hypothetical protein
VARPHLAVLARIGASRQREEDGCENSDAHCGIQRLICRWQVTK